MPAPIRKDERVLVVGAGAAGLTVAHRLKSRGFSRVTVLEASDRVGGKCWTMSMAGRSYEMGAIGFPGTRNPFLGLARSHGVGATPTFKYSFVTRKGVRALPDLSVHAPLQGLRLGPTLLRLQRPGFADLDPRLAVPMGEWLDQRGLSAVGNALRPLVTGLGYGFYSDIAAAYALKHIALFRPDAFQLADPGSQGVWARVARAVDVRLEHSVTRVERGRDGVSVTTSQGTFDGDRLVVATPPRQALAFLGSGDERALLERFQCFRYHALLCEASGLPPGSYGFFPDAHERLDPGRPVAYARRRPSDSAAVIYSYLHAGNPMSAEQVVAANRGHLQQLGARIDAVHRQHTWEYFPHVDCRDVAGGVFRRLDALQGVSRTYYVGEALAYPTVRHVVEHAFHLVQRFFS